MYKKVIHLEKKLPTKKKLKEKSVFGLRKLRKVNEEH